jgi:hypothetical protein
MIFRSSISTDVSIDDHTGRLRHALPACNRAVYQILTQSIQAFIDQCQELCSPFSVETELPLHI